jgi:LytS/YehU family sensor histidine kinase
VLLLAAGLRWRVDDPELRRWAFGLCWGTAVLVTVVLWFLAVYRSDQIAARLRELDERDRAVAMARQLATAQIRPHFLFNSLASLQHWVQTRDERAASLLEALTGFLRATLPLFERSQLKIADELEAARHYLQVMQLRLGERLRWTVRIDPRAAGIEVPPGLLLTLVENAVEHGVQASLRGATVGVAVELQGSRLRIDVIDDGPGPGRSAADGVGLSNTRARLAQAFGPAATLVLQPRAEGGCLARIEIPSPNPAPSPP